MTKILFLTESREDYLADSILHGLISLGLDIVDYPKKDILYSSYTPANIEIRGFGFSLYRLLPDRVVDRSNIIQRLQAGEFDLVILGQVWRQWGQLLDLASWLKSTRVVILDGDDDTRIFHHSLTRLRRYGLQRFPIRSGRCLYLKRELMDDPHHLTSSLCQIDTISFSIPSEKIRSPMPMNKSKRFANHCVDEEVASFCGLKSRYAFNSESQYYDDLSDSRFAITTKRGGWDCLRHYEIAAAGCLPCIRQLDLKPKFCAPHGLIPDVNCIAYSDCRDLLNKLDHIDNNSSTYQDLLHGANLWVRSYTTREVAARMLKTSLSR